MIKSGSAIMYSWNSQIMQKLEWDAIAQVAEISALFGTDASPAAHAYYAN